MFSVHGGQQDRWASYNLLALTSQQCLSNSGLPPFLGVGAGPDGATPLVSLLQASLQRLIHGGDAAGGGGGGGGGGLEAVDHAAEAVLPLALAEPAALQRCGEALLASCSGGAAKVSGCSTWRGLGCSAGHSVAAQGMVWAWVWSRVE